jgi:hypothetical protein
MSLLGLVVLGSIRTKDISKYLIIVVPGGLSGLHNGLEIAQIVALESLRMYFSNHSGETSLPTTTILEDCHYEVKGAGDAADRLGVKLSTIRNSKRS